MSRKTADLAKVIVKKGSASPAPPTKPSAAVEDQATTATTTVSGAPDGRALRRTGRTQWNVKVHPDAKAIAFRHAEKNGCALGEILERALALYDKQNQ